MGVSMSILVEVRAEPYYLLGSEVPVSIKVKNTEETIDYIDLPILSSGKLKSDIFQVLFSEDPVVDYSGMLVKYKASPVSLSYNESVQFSVLLAREYKIQEPGFYTVCSSYFGDDHGVLKIKFEVLLGAEPVQTWFDIAHTQLYAKKTFKSFGTHDVYGATDKQFEDLQVAHKKAVEASDHIAYSGFTDDVPEELGDSYSSVICKAGYHAKSTLLKFKHVSKYISSHMQYIFKSPECQSGVYGFVYKSENEKKIYLCEEYDKAQSYPTKNERYDTKVGVIIHEVTHNSVDSKDHFYGYGMCEVKALKCEREKEPKTCSNADCLQMFAEISYLAIDNQNNLTGEVQRDVDEL